MLFSNVGNQLPTNAVQHVDRH